MNHCPNFTIGASHDLVRSMSENDISTRREILHPPSKVAITHAIPPDTPLVSEEDRPSNDHRLT